MKKLFLISIVILSVINVFAQNVGKHYYYYNNEKKYLEINSDYVFISFTGTDIKQIEELRKFGLTKYKKESASSKLKQKLNEKEGTYWAEIKLGENLSSESYTQKIAAIKQLGNTRLVSPYFKSANSKKIGLSSIFYVKVKSLSDTLLLQQYAKDYNAIIANQDAFMPLWFALSCTKNTGMNALELANKLYESGMFQYAEPDLMLDDIFNSSDDTYFHNQWGLRNTGQYQGNSGIDIRTVDAWSISTGAGINVAVIDQGIQLDHPDLQANIHTLSYDTENGSSPSIVRGDHATCCAGIIGAVGNTVGIKGVAPNCRLMSVSNESNQMVEYMRQKFANGINWASQNGAHVISNSWTNNDLTSNFIDEAITNALTKGRNGLGCVVIFSTGNDNGQVVYPANSNPNILTVGAISPCGQRKSATSCDGEKWGSNFGTTLDVVAPGVLVSTTDRTGSIGINPKLAIHTINRGNKVTSDYSNMDYTVWFNGTSAACPHVAGVAALILSVNPSLTGQQVRDIIEQTAQKVGGYAYSTTPGRPNGIWHEQMGYGLINAYEAVKTALIKNLAISGPDALCAGSPATYSISNLPVDTPVTWSKSSNLNFVGSNTGSSVTVQPATTTGGEAWVEATVSYNGQPFNVTRKAIWTGAPIITNISGNQHATTAKLDETYSIVPYNSLVSASYSWQVSPSYYTLWNSGNEARISFPHDGDYLITATAQNGCGISEYQLFVAVGAYEPYIIAPNPVSDYLTISVAENKSSDISNRLPKVKAFKTTNSTSYSVKVFNSMGIPVYSTVKRELSFSIPTINFNKGHYFITITDGYTSYKKGFIVIH